LNKKVDQNGTSERGMELVMFRNAFYRDQYRCAVVILIILMAVNVTLLFGSIYKITHPPTTQYFAITPDGRIINSRPLSDPTVTDTYVLQWSADKVREAFSQDFVHYRGQLQGVADAFTQNGWKDFYNSLESTNNLKTLVNKKMVSDVKITTPPVVLQKSVVSGHYAWKVRMSIMISYISDSKVINMPFEVTLIVLRESVSNYPDRIAINNFLPVVQDTGSGQLLTM
jgi:intracellular multiplication protein IcmL